METLNVTFLWKYWGMSYITHFVVFHTFLGRSQIDFKLWILYSVLFPVIEVKCKGYFLIINISKIRYFLFVLILALGLCFITEFTIITDLSIWCMINYIFLMHDNPEVHFLLTLTIVLVQGFFLQIGGWYNSENKIKYRDNIPF